MLVVGLRGTIELNSKGKVGNAPARRWPFMIPENLHLMLFSTSDGDRDGSCGSLAAVLAFAR